MQQHGVPSCFAVQLQKLSSSCVCAEPYAIAQVKGQSCMSAHECCEAFSWNAAVAYNPLQQWGYLYRAPAFLPQLAFNSPLVGICIVFCLSWHWRCCPIWFFFFLFPCHFLLLGRVFVVYPFPSPLVVGSVILETRSWKLHVAFLLQTAFNMSFPKVFFFFSNVCSQVKSLCQ